MPSSRSVIFGIIHGLGGVYHQNLQGAVVRFMTALRGRKLFVPKVEF
jgi:hypothetical protein